MQQDNHLLAIAVEKAEVPTSTKMPGQGVLKQQPEEICSGKSSCLDVSGIFGVAKGDIAVLARQNVLFLKDATIEVLPEVDQSLVATAYKFGIDDPVLRQGRLHLQVVDFHRLKPFGAEDDSKALLSEEVLALLAAPESSASVDGACGDDEVDMGVVIQPS